MSLGLISQTTSHYVKVLRDERQKSLVTPCEPRFLTNLTGILNGTVGREPRSK